MTQNIYDDPGFFEGYSRLRRSVEGLDGAPEWPALRALLPDLRGLRRAGPRLRLRLVLPLGARARRRRSPRPRCLRANAGARAGDDRGAGDHLRARRSGDASSCRRRRSISSTARWPCTTSSDLERAAGAGAPGAASAAARLVFSVEHPIYTAPGRSGLAIDAAGRKTWPVDGYLDEGPRSTDWLAKGVIKQHRTLATYLALLRSGLHPPLPQGMGADRGADRRPSGLDRAPASAVPAAGARRP